jgi:hypothetical protein
MRRLQKEKPENLLISQKKSLAPLAAELRRVWLRMAKDKAGQAERAAQWQSMARRTGKERQRDRVPKPSSSHVSHMSSSSDLNHVLWVASEQTKSKRDRERASQGKSSPFCDPKSQQNFSSAEQNIARHYESLRKGPGWQISREDEGISVKIKERKRKPKAREAWLGPAVVAVS